jgi:ATP-dependent helicase/nuclease subunit A
MPTPLIRDALDPRGSAVVEACAGSGKTWLLVSRIIRLLLDGAEPSNILAITFTRKAAQEMQARLSQWLRFMATAPDADVRAFLAQRALPGAEIESLLPRARKLFEQTLTAQPGVTINTFHGWFLELLKHAPLSAGTGSAALVEQTSALLDEAWQNLADELATADDSGIDTHLKLLFRDYGLENTQKLLRNFIQRRAEWQAFTQDKADSLSAACEQLRLELGVDPAADPIGRFFAEQGEVEAAFVAQLLAGGTEKQQTEAARLHRNQRADPEYFSELHAVLLTKEGTPRKAIADRARKQGDSAEGRYRALCERVLEVEAALAEQKAWRANVAALACGVAYLDHYRRLKQDRGQIDFVDIESRVWQLLADSEHAEYMQHKLDARYRHILLDEFQDTNPLQWQILRAWLDASEAAGTHPTVFLVGDPKQSIYRFRGAEPRLFGQATEYLAAYYGARHLQQNESRRCAPAIIDAVNRTLAKQPAFPHFHAHTAHNAALPGGVCLLPVAEAPQLDEPPRESLRNPLNEALAERHRAQAIEARHLAQTISQLVGRLQIADDTRTRPARHGDIMVLARSRTHLAHFEDAFKAAGIPYLTARRGGLLDTLEALDLTALLEFLVMPFADLRLAHVLRTPIFAASDTDLIALSGREERTWWQRLRAMVAAGAASPALRRAHARLERWRTLTDSLPVHDLLDRIYFEGDVLAAYGAAAPEPMRSAVQANLLAFIELALKVQGGRYPSLPKFLEELRGLREAAEEESPSEAAPEAGVDAVHIHTVHGAKGLERPIVCLIDTHRAENSRDTFDVLVDWEPGAPAPGHFSLYTVKDERGSARSAYFARQQEFAATENFNLLYVAMTRAKQYLIVSGSDNDKAQDSWYQRLRAALPKDTLDLTHLPALAADRTTPAAAATFPGMTQACPTGQRMSSGKSAARLRGIALHRLLEYLTVPGAAPDRAAFRRELGLELAAFDALWQEAEAIVATPALARYFDPAQYQRACNELAYVNAQGELRRIDRLVEFHDEVWILDYKMGEVPTEQDLSALAAPYRKQIAEYRCAMASVFPERPIRTALIFSGGRLHEILP